MRLVNRFIGWLSRRRNERDTKYMMNLVRRGGPYVMAPCLHCGTPAFAFRDGVASCVGAPCIQRFDKSPLKVFGVTLPAFMHGEAA